MKKFIYFLVVIIIYQIPNIIAQSNENITLLCKTKFNREKGAGDVWGVQINGINYALVTLDGGLSVVNTDNPSIPSETAHINHEDYAEGKRLNVGDVETFVSGGTTYAYLATNSKDDDPPNPYPLVIIINLNSAISQGGTILIHPKNDTPSPTSVFAGKIVDYYEIKQSHTLTIGGDYLYVATLNDSLPVWDLGASPTSPEYLGFITVNPLDAAIHEMFVKSLSSQSARVYVSCLTGGLQVLELSYNPTEGGSTSITVDSRVEHLYDFDRAYPNQRESGDPFFDYRFTHSAWPTADEQYIFTS